MADELDTGEPQENGRKERDGFSWWDLPDLVEAVAWIGRGVWSLGALIVGVFRN